MQVNQAASSITFLIAVFLAVLLYFYFWQKRQPPGSSYLLVSMAGASLWMSSAILALSANPGPAQDFWLFLAATGSHLMPPAWLAFTLYFTGRAKWLSPGKLLISFVPAALSILLAWTNPLHSFYWSPNAEAAGPFFWVTQIFNQLYLLISLGVLLSSFRLPGQAARSHMTVMILCTLIPWMANLLFLTRSFFIRIQDPSPYFISFSVILFTYTLLHLRMLNVMSPAIDAALDAMTNGVIVMTMHNQVLYLNPAAEKILARSASTQVGQPAEQVFAQSPFLLKILEQEETNALEAIRVERDESHAYYSVSVSKLTNRTRKQIGKMMLIEDVTNRVQAELASQESQEKQRQSEEVYRQLVENINEVIYTIDLQGQITYISQVAERSMGFHLQNLVGQHYRQIISLEDNQNLAAVFQRTLAGERETFEFRINNANGSPRTLRARQQRLMHDGRVVGVQGMLIDITEQLHIEQALERRASQLAILNDIGEKIAALMDLDGVLDSATHLIQTNFGYYHVALWLPDPDQKELVMRSASGAFSSIFPENHRLNFGQGMVGWVADHSVMLLASDVRKEPHYTNFFPDKILTRSELTVPILLGDELVGVLDIQSPLLNAFDDNDVRVMRTIGDQIAIAIENARLYNQVLTQLKETERKENMLRIQRDLVVAISSATKAHEMLDVALEILALELDVQHAAIFLLNDSCSCLEPAATLGYPPDMQNEPLAIDQGVAGWVARTGQPTLIGNVLETPGYMVSNLDTRSEVCVPLISGSDVIGVIILESQQPHAFNSDDLRLLVILANNLVVLIERARLFQEVEQARAELETRASALESANERLRELDRMKSQFLANMSHELRTPLNSVIGFSEILLDNLAGPLNADQAECITNIHVSGKHLLALINDLLDFSKIEAGRLTIEATPFVVSELFDELHSTFLPLAEKKAQLLSLSAAPDLPMLTADRLRLKQVFVNLLGNANKFTPQGGLINATCCREDEDHLLFMVKDNGIGIRPEHQDIIFEEFRQVDGSMTREAAGTGLGLAISKRIIQLHHGEIWVESEFGQGTCFYVRLPITYQVDML